MRNARRRSTVFSLGLALFGVLAVVGAPAALAHHSEIAVTYGCDASGGRVLQVTASSWSFEPAEFGNHDDVGIQMRRQKSDGTWTGWVHEIGSGQFLPGARSFVRTWNDNSVMADFETPSGDPETLATMAGETVQIRLHQEDTLPNEVGDGWYNDSGVYKLDATSGNANPLSYYPPPPDPDNAAGPPAGFVIPIGCVHRLFGANRYSTAVAASKYAYPSGADVVYVATGEQFPDALAGGAAAAHENAPVLLVQKGTIPSTTKNELVRLSPSRIVVLGGTAVIDDQVVTDLRAYAASVTRVAGANRYATSAAVSKAAFGSSAVAYVATGVDFPDALAAAPAAVQAGAPLLLVRADELPTVVATELDRLGATTIVVVGGTAAVSDAVVASLAEGGRTVTRIAGATRYALSANVSKATFAPGVAAAYVVVGTEFPDALSAGAVTGPNPGPVLLVQTNSLPTVVANELNRLAPDEIYIIGGPAVVSDTVAGILGGYLQ